MFDVIRNNTKALMFVLVLLIIPSFVLVGIQGYTNFRDGNATVAKVAGTPITQAEWDAAHRTQVERIRAQSPGVDPKLLDSPEFKQQTLEALVRERTMLTAADKEVRSMVEQHPVAMLLGAAGLGFIIARLAQRR